MPVDRDDMSAGALPRLPCLSTLPCPSYRGPTPWCNWVLKPCLLAGAYPASLDDHETSRILESLLELGVTTFVCLQAEASLHTPESAWRNGQGLRPYIKDAQAVLVCARRAHSTRILQDKLDFLHLPIIDGSVTSDSALGRLADDCCERLLRGERLYVHCWGGHGRTGTLLAVMLGRLYGLPCSTALRYTQVFHDSRRYPQGVRSPQTQPQVAQVMRLLPEAPSSPGGKWAGPAGAALPAGKTALVTGRALTELDSDSDGDEQPLALPALGQYSKVLSSKQLPAPEAEPALVLEPPSPTTGLRQLALGASTSQWSSISGGIAEAVQMQAQHLRKFMLDRRVPGMPVPVAPAAPDGSSGQGCPGDFCIPACVIAGKPATTLGVVSLRARAGPVEEGHGAPCVTELRPSREVTSPSDRPATLPSPEWPKAAAPAPGPPLGKAALGRRTSLLSFLPTLWG